MPGIDHLDIVVSSVDRSLGFYGELLAPMGWRYARRVVGERGETIEPSSGRSTHAPHRCGQRTADQIRELRILPRDTRVGTQRGG